MIFFNKKFHYFDKKFEILFSRNLFFYHQFHSFLLTFWEIISQIFKYHTIKFFLKPCQQQQVNISQQNLTVEQTRGGLGSKEINITGQLSNDRKSIQDLHLTRSWRSHILEVYCLLLALLVRKRRHNG